MQGEAGGYKGMTNRGWAAVALAGDILPNTSQAATIGSQSVVVWRGDDAEVNIWENRCPHRGMPLSFGFVREGTLKCLYHGWGFRTDAQCSTIPAHPDLVPPKTICAKPFFATTRNGIVWASLDREAPAFAADMPTDEGWVAIRSLFLSKGPEATRDAILTSQYFNAEGGLLQLDDLVLQSRLASGVELMIALQPVSSERTGIHISARCLEGEGVPGALLAQHFAEFRNTAEGL